MNLFLNNLISIDIYSLVKLFKTHLGLKNCKQKTIEDLLGITREDKFNGGELIPQYFEYMKTNDEVLLHNLLLHNAEDCIGMLKLLDITDYIKLVMLISQGNYKINITTSSSSESFNFSLILEDTGVVLATSLIPSAAATAPNNSNIFLLLKYVTKPLKFV